MAFSGMGARERGSLDARYYLRTDGTFVELLDEDDMASDDATKAPSQQSVKAYIDGEVAGINIPEWTYTTEQATTSGTAFDFTSIPSGVAELELVLEGCSLNGALGNHFLVQIGDGGGIETTGYEASSGYMQDGITQTVGGYYSTSAFPIFAYNAANTTYAAMRLMRTDSGGLKWATMHGGRCSGSSLITIAGGGVKTLSAELTQLRLTRTNAVSFDAGTVYLRYR